MNMGQMIPFPRTDVDAASTTPSRIRPADQETRLQVVCGMYDSPERQYFLETLKGDVEYNTYARVMFHYSGSWDLVVQQSQREAHLLILHDDLRRIVRDIQGERPPLPSSPYPPFTQVLEVTRYLAQQPGYQGWPQIYLFSQEITHDPFQLHGCGVQRQLGLPPELPSNPYVIVPDQVPRQRVVRDMRGVVNDLVNVISDLDHHLFDTSRKYRVGEERNGSLEMSVIQRAG